MLRNYKEVFCSKIPPSMINFRAWTSKDDDIVSGSTTSEGDRGFVEKREKFDIEVGQRFSKDAGKGLQIILRNLDYSAFDDNKKRKNLDQSGFDDPFKRNIGDKDKYSHQSSGIGSSTSYDKRTVSPIS